MGSLDHDTAVEGGDGRYRAVLSEDWAIWGPNGGYVAAVALRAAGAHSSQPRPVSLLCQFLGVAAFDAVDIEVTTLRATKRAEAMRVSITQAGQPILEAMVWGAADELGGLQHDDAPAPHAPPPEALRSLDDVEVADERRLRFWSNIENRPLVLIEDWERRAAGDPEFVGWFRFRPDETFKDPFLDACRLAVLVDTLNWPAAARAYDQATLGYLAPSLDLACWFHRPASHEPWLLARAHSQVASGGLVAGTTALWDRNGRLLASGGQQMLCRPVPPGAIA